MIARLVIDPRYLPDWFVEDYPGHIPLPSKRCHELKGEVIAWGICGEKKIPLLSTESGVIFSQYDWDEWRYYILREKYREIIRPFYTRLPFHYHIVPAILRNIAAGLLLSHRASSTIPRNDFPGFPIEQGFELLCHVYQQNGASQDLESDQRSRIILTHDIDTKAGFKWVKKIAKLEIEYGFRSLWNVVGCRYKIEYGILDWLIENGFEIGLHGYNHDNKLIFLPESTIRYRLDQCHSLISRYRITSFRSPSWFRNEKLFNILKDYFQYDYSCLDTDVTCPGGTGGCLWTKSFSLSGLTHIPTTVPFEVPLFFRNPPEQLVQFWKPKLEWLRTCNGNIVVNTHADPHYSGNVRMLAVYEELLNRLKNLV